MNAWTQLFGLVSFEMFGQTRGLIDDHEAFTRESATAMATRDRLDLIASVVPRA